MFQMKRAFVFRLKHSSASGEIRCLQTARRIHGVETTRPPERPMKPYRLITLIAAVLITVLFARVLTGEKIGSLDEAHAATLEAP